MGQFLAIGMVNRLLVPRKFFVKTKATVSDLAATIQKSQGYDMSLFDVINDEDEEDIYLRFVLKKEIFQRNIHAFLEELYPILYPYSDDDSLFEEHYKEILALLKEGKFAECDTIANGGNNFTYRFDSFGLSETPIIRMSGERDYLVLGLINFFTNSGKIATENGLREVSRMFEYAFCRLFKDQPLARLLKLYISG